MRNLKSFIFIRHKLFFIDEGIADVNHPKQLSPWTRSRLIQEFGSEAISQIKSVDHPKDLSDELKYLYLIYLENKVYKWHQYI